MHISIIITYYIFFYKCYFKIYSWKYNKQKLKPVLKFITLKVSKYLFVHPMRITFYKTNNLSTASILSSQSKIVQKD